VLDEARAMAEQVGISAELLHVPDAHPATAIIETAKSRGCDLIVMASHGRRGIRKLLLGSQTSERHPGHRAPACRCAPAGDRLPHWAGFASAGPSRKMSAPSAAPAGARGDVQGGSRMPIGDGSNHMPRQPIERGGHVAKFRLRIGKHRPAEIAVRSHGMVAVPGNEPPCHQLFWGLTNRPFA
jgi:hypothetical protein